MLDLFAFKKPIGWSKKGGFLLFLSPVSIQVACKGTFSLQVRIGQADVTFEVYLPFLSWTMSLPRFLRSY